MHAVSRVPHTHTHIVGTTAPVLCALNFKFLKGRARGHDQHKQRPESSMLLLLPVHPARNDVYPQERWTATMDMKRYMYMYISTSSVL